jgi:hypothetical protein
MTRSARLVLAIVVAGLAAAFLFQLLAVSLPAAQRALVAGLLLLGGIMIGTAAAFLLRNR